MAISDRIQSMYEHVEDIYDSVELTGVDTTDIDKNLVNVPNTLKEGYIDIINNGTDTLYNNFPKVSGEGTSLTLNNTYQAPMRNLLKGNTYQTQYSGKNLLPPTIVTETKNGITLTNNGDGSYTLTGTYSTITQFSIDLPTTLNGTYSFSGNNPASSNNIQFRILKSSGSPWYTYLNKVNKTSENQTIENGTKQEIRIVGSFTSGFTFKPQLESGSTATSYEPYVGGVATPNPTNPADVNVVSGDNEILVNGKNFFPVSLKYNGTSILQVRSTITLDNDEYVFSSTGADMYFGAVVASGSAFSNSYGSLIVIPSNATNVYLYVTNSDFNNNFICFYDANKSSLGYSSITTSKSIPSGAKYFNVRIGKSNSVSGTTYRTKVMVSFETITTYEPYQGNTYNIDLPSGMELCKIGNYQDYFYKDSDKWYLHKEIGKVTYNGTENWTTFAINYEYQIILQDAKEGDYENQFFPSLCNKYVNHNVGGASLNNYEFSNFTSGVYRWIRIRHNDITTLANYKTWLASNTPTFYYLLATPTNTEITDTTLINQLEEIYIAKSKNNQTNISQINNDLPFIISASALKKGDTIENNSASLLMSFGGLPNTNGEEETPDFEEDVSDVEEETPIEESIEEETDEEPVEEETDEEPVEEETEIEEEGE